MACETDDLYQMILHVRTIRCAHIGVIITCAHCTCVCVSKQCSTTTSPLSLSIYSICVDEIIFLIKEHVHLGKILDPPLLQVCDGYA